MKTINYRWLGKDFFKNEEAVEISTVKQILSDVKEEGDAAVKLYTEKFDKIRLKSFEVSKDQIKAAYQKVDGETIRALKKAVASIRYFAKLQFRQLKSFEVKRRGIVLGQKVIPIERVGCYVPSGKYPLPSTALMTIIPAKIAEVKEVIVCSPNIAPVTVVAADMAGADRIFNIGGVQAIAAMAYGTETMPKVDKIVGPGNRFVAAAKREVFGIVGIDLIAGPSEVMVIADDTSKPEFVAADLLAQAEHDANAKTYLITTSKMLAQKVNKQLKLQLASLKTKEVANASLKNGLIILTNTIKEAVEIANKKAPEHLELQFKGAVKYINRFKNYGSLFIGPYSAEVLGDYCTGPNHVLPTNRAATYTGGLSVRDFVKIVTWQKVGRKAVGRFSKVAAKLADVEGLAAHKSAAEIRQPRGLNKNYLSQLRGR